MEIVSWHLKYSFYKSNEIRIRLRSQVLPVSIHMTLVPLLHLQLQHELHLYHGKDEITSNSLSFIQFYLTNSLWISQINIKPAFFINHEIVSLFPSKLITYTLCKPQLFIIIDQTTKNMAKKKRDPKNSEQHTLISGQTSQHRAV